MKQRVRKLIEYTWADPLGYAVIGTPNLLEYDQGFFVKGGDGLADVKPIARLYKTQVYALARQLGLPRGDRRARPTTETFSLPQTQEEFYFGHPYDRMDLLVHGARTGIAPAELAPLVGLDAEGVEAAYGEIAARPRRDRLPARQRAHRRRRRLEPPGRPLTCAASPASCTPTRRARRRGALRRMARALRHRGPDGYGIASGGGAGLVSTRLAIFDIPSGWQPMQAPSATRCSSTTARSTTTPSCAPSSRPGERFRTTCDTEVVLRLLERDGPRRWTAATASGARAPGTGPRAR